MDLLIHSSNTSCRVASLFLAAVVGLAGCDTNDAVPDATKTPTSSYQPDPPAQLRKIAELGKAKALSSGNEGQTFVDASVEAIKSSSLTYSYVGRITVDLKARSGDRINSYAIYFKHDGNRWLLAKWCYGIKGGGFPGPLTQEKALAPAVGVFEADSPRPLIQHWVP